MRIYLAARYSRREELCGYREQLRAKGYDVQAVWLDGEHQISNEGVPIGESGEALVEGSSPLKEVVFVEPVQGTEGGFLVTLECGHKLATRTKAMNYRCKTCQPLRSGEKLSEHERSERAAAMRQKFAQDDFRDVTTCQLLIAFTEPPRSNSSRGGRHVELGIALGQMKRVWIVGPRENIFCWLEDVRQFETWADCLATIPGR